MSAHIRARELFGLLLPLGCKNGRLAMLKAYLDDSGSHGPSPIVVVGGVMGTESEIESLDGLWREVLANPIDGRRSAIREFKAHDCFTGKGEFADWTRNETDYLRLQLRDVIIHSHVSGYGLALAKKEWNEIIIGDTREILGDAEGNAVTSCFVRVLKWAQMATFDPDLSFIFDDSDKLDHKRYVMAVYDAFKQQTTVNNVCGIAFLDSSSVSALQAADMMAWEFNRYGQLILKHGIETPAPPEILHLHRKMGWLDGQIGLQNRIIEVRENAIRNYSPEVLAEFANHFRTFSLDQFSSSKPKRKKRRS